MCRSETPRREIRMVRAFAFWSKLFRAPRTSGRQTLMGSFVKAPGYAGSPKAALVPIYVGLTGLIYNTVVYAGAVVREDFKNRYMYTIEIIGGV